MTSPGGADPVLHINEETGRFYGWSINTMIEAMLWVLQ